MSSPWPGIDYGYQDPEGFINLDVYNVAGTLVDDAERLAVKMLQDKSAGPELLLKAVVRVSERLAKGGEPIRDLKYYLLRTYINLIKERLRGLKPTEPYEDDVASDAFWGNFAQYVERRICVQQLVSQMDDSTREVFECRVLGHSYEEIGRDKGVSGNIIRSKFHKGLRRLARAMRSDTTAREG